MQGSTHFSAFPRFPASPQRSRRLWCLGALVVPGVGHLTSKTMDLNQPLKMEGTSHAELATGC
jgi:hypothetical protein